MIETEVRMTRVDPMIDVNLWSGVPAGLYENELVTLAVWHLEHPETDEVKTLLTVYDGHTRQFMQDGLIEANAVINAWLNPKDELPF